MLYIRSLLASAALLATTAMQAQAKAVFAHFIVGNAADNTAADWAEDIQMAQDAGIDGFALNIAADSYTTQVLDTAYTAAGTAGNFSMFLSFDYAANPAFDVDTVSNYIKTYRDNPAQFMYNGQPLVSTFEGPEHSGDWPAIKAASGGCFFVPDWTSVKGSGSSAFTNADGALSWDVWPNGPSPIDSSIDDDWKQILDNKVYMMGISPWFYTNLPAYTKNWLWRGDDLWYDRWQQAIELQPDLIEILTWNDFGESHYVGPLRPSGFPTGSERYAANNPHDGWREMLPYFIAQYKSGNTTAPAVNQVKIVYSHRPNPASSGSADGTTGNDPSGGQVGYPPSQVSQDNISLDVLVKAAADVTVQIGDNPVTVLRAMNAGVNHFSIPFQGQTGNVTYTVSRYGRTILNHVGAEISSDCQDGLVNWNAIVGSAAS